MDLPDSSQRKLTGVRTVLFFSVLFFCLVIPTEATRLFLARLFAFAALIALVSAAATTLLAQSTLVGTWKLNLAKSKYNAGSAPKSLTRTVESQGDQVKYTFEGVAADGKALAYTFTGSYDGKGYPITGSGAPAGADTITIKRLNPSSYASVLKKAGQPVLATTAKVSRTF